MVIDTKVLFGPPSPLKVGQISAMDLRGEFWPI